jgi:hypothetical protein
LAKPFLNFYETWNICMMFTDIPGLPVGVLVYTYILSLEKVKCRSVSESNVTAASCFGGLFASVLGGEMKQGKPASWDALLCSLLKLVNKLVQTPLTSHAHVSCSNHNIRQ